MAWKWIVSDILMALLVASVFGSWELPGVFDMGATLGNRWGSVILHGMSSGILILLISPIMAMILN